MKIPLYGLNYYLEPVGIGKYSGELGRWFSSRGHEVRVITSPPCFPSWSVSGGYRNSFYLEHLCSVRVRRCPLWVPRRPSGLTRLLHLASFALASLGPLLAQLRWRPDVVNYRRTGLLLCSRGFTPWALVRSKHYHLAPHTGFRARCCL